MSKLIHPTTPEIAYQVSLNLNPEDYAEVYEGHGHDPRLYLPIYTMVSDAIHFTNKEGDIAGCAGVQPDGCIWMLCTPVIYKHTHLFVRTARKWLDSRPERVLWNYMDKRNTTHLKLLKHLGFTFLREVPFGPNQLPFIEFVRCVRPRSQLPDQS